jgi:hypothetical protein
MKPHKPMTREQENAAKAALLAAGRERKPKKRTRAQEVQAVMRASIYEKADTINALLTALRQITDEETFFRAGKQTSLAAIQNARRIASDAIAKAC